MSTSDPKRKEALLHPDLLSRVASERLKDDHDGLEPESDGTPTLEPGAIVIRPAHEDDAGAIVRLAALDERPVPAGKLLVAEVEGAVEAAISLEGREAIANPFSESGPAVSLLFLRAAQLRAA